jgi:beta-lactam-binding protein with PASTA domain
MNYRRRRGLGSAQWVEAFVGRFRGLGFRSGLLRPGRWALTLAISVVFVGIGYLIATRWLFPAPSAPGGEKLVELPELVGLETTRAEEKVRELGLDYDASSEVYHARAAAGLVVAQSPLPGQLARPGAPVRVTVSLGPQRVVIPDVIGLSERQARIILEQLGFTTTIRSRDAAVRSGQVLDTSPEAGTELSVPSEVELVVSKGFDVAPVPDLIGRHANDVEEILAELGLSLGVVSFDEDALDAPGRVIGQTPPAGYNLRAGGRVAIQVAGPRFRIERRLFPGAAGASVQAGESNLEGSDEGSSRP